MFCQSWCKMSAAYKCLNTLYIAYFASIRTLKLEKSGVEACSKMAYAKGVYFKVG